MPWVSIGASVLGSVASSLLGGKGGKLEAKDAQAAQIRQQEDAKRQATAYLSPFADTGMQANETLARALGIANPTGYAPRPTRKQFEDELSDWHFKWAGRGYNRNSNMGGVNLEIDKRYNAALKAWEEGKADYVAQHPGSQGDGFLTHQFTNEDFVKDPGYQARLDEGTKGIDRAASARGGYDSGATLKALAKYNQDYASNEFNNAFTRDSSNKNQLYNFLSGTSGQGQNAATSLATGAAAAANNNSNTIANTAANIQNQQNYANANLNNSIQSGIGNSLYAYQQAKNKGTTSTDWTGNSIGTSKATGQTSWYA
ncbi:MAG: hypothetical protein V4440_14540 [Pseudomonadota bacterium]